MQQNRLGNEKLQNKHKNGELNAQYFHINANDGQKKRFLYTIFDVFKQILKYFVSWQKHYHHEDFFFRKRAQLNENQECAS